MNKNNLLLKIINGGQGYRFTRLHDEKGNLVSLDKLIVNAPNMLNFQVIPNRPLI